MTGLKLKLLDGDFSIHRFNESAEIPSKVFQSGFFNINKSDEELSIVCPSSLELDSEQCNQDWSCIKVLGPLDFNLTGVLAKISGVLAEAQISIFALSTYDTDYILVKSVKAKDAVAVLEGAGYQFP
ncbi:MAG: ACT domain-containing protein [Desulfobacteraceae bacterium]|nr:ACT domain-containing protein [Desulfobacteraceae bacterium]